MTIDDVLKERSVKKAWPLGNGTEARGLILRRERPRVPVFKQDSSSAGFQLAGQQLEQCGFPTSASPLDQLMRTRFNFQADSVEDTVRRLVGESCILNPDKRSYGGNWVMTV